MATKNLYYRRLVAESGARACWVCYKPSTTVLITPENDDWFHLCPGHLSDRNFATPKDEDLAKKKREEEIQKEMEAVKKEFEEKMRKKMERRKQKEYDKDSEKKKEEKKDEKQDDDKDEKEKEEKLKALEKQKEPGKAAVEGPRIFELQKNFWQMRVQKKRDAEITRKNRETLKAAGGFPSVPTGNP